ncbi:MAG: site-specific DNA-methyltransferase [Myxococcales bacterium]|nr:site-specific DNA-methyltransferase [Myxococcales bacterium]
MPAQPQPFFELRSDGGRDPLALFDKLPVRHRGARHRLIEGDSLALLAKLPAASVDLVFADPPYNLSNGGTTCQSGKRVAVDKGAWDVSQGVGADHDFHRRWLGACRRVLKPSGTIWVSGTQHVIFSLGFAMQELGYHLLNTVTWFKPNASPNLACRMFTHSTEIVIWASPERGKPLRHTFNYPQMKAQNGGKQMRDMWPLSDDGGGVMWDLATPGKREKLEGRHPTQKPIALLDRIITAATNPGDLVIDPFNGSGTTGVVAVARGRRYAGFDHDPAYLDLTSRRLAAVLR